MGQKPLSRKRGGADCSSFVDPSYVGFATDSNPNRAYTWTIAGH